MAETDNQSSGARVYDLVAPSLNSVLNTRADSILIVTVTKVEAQAVLEVFSHALGKKWTRQHIGENIYYNLGIHGGAPVFMVQSEMGTATPGGTLVTVSDAIRDLHPQAVISCGIAYGLRSEKQKLGDILVSRQLEYYEPQKLDYKHGQMQREDRVMASEHLLRQFRSGDNDWTGAQTHFGLVLSGEKLVNNPDFRDWLLKVEPEAIGGEMEGAGLYTAARNTKVDWILVKAICDWADGTKIDDAQPLAAHNAAQFVLHVLQLGGWSGFEPSPIVVPSLLPTTKAATLSDDPGSESKHPPGFLIRQNPFIYGRPVQPGEFVDREVHLRMVFDRLRNGESTAIVGEPHIGKSSLLIQIANKETQMHFIGDDFRRMVFSSLTLHHIENGFTQAEFWKQALEPMRKLNDEHILSTRLQELANSNYSGKFLEDFFRSPENKFQLVLLLDEFETLLHHHNFQEFSFYATLRTVDAYPSFSMVLASRPSLTELEELAQKLPGYAGSDAFNLMTEEHLLPFSVEGLNLLLDRAGNAFSYLDRLFIRYMAGRRPYLVQAMANALLGTVGEVRFASAAKQYHDQICRHFDDLWRALDDRTRAAVVILGLIEIRGCKTGESIDYSDLGDQFNIVGMLSNLVEQGLAEPIGKDDMPSRKCLFFQGQWWTLGTRAFTCWICSVVVTGKRKLPTYNEWLNNKGYRDLLSQDQWERLHEKTRTAVGSQMCDIGIAAEEMFKEMVWRRENGSTE